MTRIRPYVVGQESVIVVGMEGVVEAVSDDGITIGGITMPNRLDHDRGVRYVSMVWPEGDTCKREHCDDNGCDIDPEEDLRADHEALIDAIHDWHGDSHKGAFRFCEHVVCKEASR